MLYSPDHVQMQNTDQKHGIYTPDTNDCSGGHMWLMSWKQAKGERQGKAGSSVAASCAGCMLIEHRHCLACSPASGTQDELKKYLQSEYVV